jgi:hypothetical protein
MHITEDLVLGAKFRYTRQGGTLVRMFDVSGLTPGKDTLAQAAVAADSSTGLRIPRYGDSHPAVYGLYVISIETDPIQNSRTAARVTVVYGSPELGPVPNAVQIIISGSSARKLTSINPDGSPMIVKYTDPSGNVLQDRLQIPVLSPNTILQFIRLEPSSPLRLSATFRRTVNSTSWQGGNAKTWLCRAIDARSQANLARYAVRYVFEYDPDGWTRLEYYVDRYTGKIPDDVQTSNNNDKGIAKILPYATADFSQLGLPNAF